MQTLDAIFGGFFDSKTRVNGDYNKINHFTPFAYVLAMLFTESECIHFQHSRYVDLRLNNGIYRHSSLVNEELKLPIYEYLDSHPSFPEHLPSLANGKNFDLNRGLSPGQN